MSAIGLRVGPFEIEDEVQVPVSGNWFRAHRAGLKRRQPSDVLIRMAAPSPSDQELSSLQRYFEALRGLDDSRIPSALAFYEGTGALAVVADCGLSLARILPLQRDGRLMLDLATLSDLAIDVLEALQHAHGKGQVHGHLSPHMVTLTATGHPWIWGFGEGPMAKSDPQWLPPDLARSGPASVASDQWSFGAFLGGLILGDAPWASDNPLGEAKIGNVDLYTDRIFKACPELAPLIQRMMAVQPLDRHPSLGPVHQEMLALSRRAKGTSKRRQLTQWVEEAEARVFEAPAELPEAVEVDTPTVRKSPVNIPEEAVEVVAPDVDLGVPEAIVEAPPDGAVAPDVSDVFKTNDKPARSPDDAPPSPGTTQVGRPVPLSFDETGGARTVVPNTDAGTSVEEVFTESQRNEDAVPTVLNAPPRPPVSTLFDKPSETPPDQVKPFEITQYAPWLALAAGVILVIFSLFNLN